MLRKIWVTSLCLSVFGLSGLSAGTRFSLSLKCGLYAPSSSTLNQEIVGPVNTAISDFVTQARSLGFTAKSSEMKEIGSALVFGGEAEWYFVPRFSAALGVEFYRSSPTASLEASGNEGTVLYVFNQGFDIKGRVVPILLTFRYHLPLKSLDAGLGVGVGYYLGWLDYRTSMDLKVNNQSMMSDVSETETSGQAVLPHLSAGLSWEFMNRLSLAVDIRYVIGKISTFKIDKTTDSSDSSGTLMYTDTNGNEKPVVWDLDGLSAGVCLRFKF